MAEQFYSFTEIADGISGYTNKTGANEEKLSANSAIVLFITGTAATLKLGPEGQAPFKVYFDSEAAFVPTISSGEITLFSGVADVQHIVSIISEPAFVNDWNIIPTNEAQILTVTGAVPAMIPGPIEFVSWPSFVGLYSGPRTAAAGGDLTPLDLQVEPATPARGMITIRTQASDLYLFTAQLGVWVSTNKNPPVFVDLGDPTGRRRLRLVLSGLDDTQVNEYTIWSNEFSALSTQGVLPVLNGVVASLVAVPAKATMTWLGNSIIYGAGPGAGPGDVETRRVMVDSTVDASGCQVGVSGQNVKG